MRKTLENLTSSKWSGLLSLSLGTILSQGLNVVIQPLLTRLISPSDLGQYSYIMSIAELFIPIASLNLNMLIVTAKDDAEAQKITRLSFYSVFILMIIYIIFIFISSNFIQYGLYELIYLLTITPLIIFTSGIYQVIISKDNREKLYKNIAVAEITKVGSMGSVQVLSGILNFGVVGQLVGKLVSPLYYIKDHLYYIFKTIKSTSLLSYFKDIKLYFRHILFSVPSQFISAFSYTLIMLSIVSLYSTEEVGYYSVSVRVLGLPIILVSYNLGKVYLQKISEDRNNHKSIFNTFVNTVKKLSVISLGVFTIIAIVAPRAAEIIFGEGYDEAGHYISILCIMFFVRLITSSLTGTFIVIKKQNIQMLLEALFIIAGTIIYIASRILTLSIYQYLLTISISYGIIYLIILLYLGIQCKLWDTKRNIF